MHVFTPGTEYARLYRNRFIAALIALFAGVIAVSMLFGAAPGETDDQNIVFAVVCSAAILALLLRRVVKNSSGVIGSYRLEVSENELTLIRRSFSPLNLKAGDIRDIRKVGRGKYVVFGKQPHIHVYLSPFAKEPLALEAALNRLRPVSSGSYWPAFSVPRIVLLMVWFTALIVVLSPAVDQVPIVIAAAGINWLLSVWVYIRGRRSVNVSARMKGLLWMSWLTNSLVVAVTVMKVMGDYR